MAAPAKTLAQARPAAPPDAAPRASPPEFTSCILLRLFQKTLMGVLVCLRACVNERQSLWRRVFAQMICVSVFVDT